MFRFPLAASLVLALLASGTATADAVRDLPKPVQSFARQFAAECRSNGLGDLVLSDHYRAQFPGRPDVNGDGKPDYVVYKCMFGCSGNPDAFLGLATPCPWGNLLLSEGKDYRQIFLPGLVNRMKQGPPMRIAVVRPRALRLEGNFCNGGFPDTDQQHVYELRDGRFQVLGTCGPEGCASLMDRVAAFLTP